MMPATMSSIANESARERDDERLADSREFSSYQQDIVVVQPSFDSASSRKSMNSPSKQHQDWQTRSPNDERKVHEMEQRNPSSPPKEDQQEPLSPHHERNLSAHFFDATTLDPTVQQVDEKVASRKHRRMFSGDNPAIAHRRINSIGTSEPIQKKNHHRVESGGLDMLSDAIEVAKGHEYASSELQQPRLHDSRFAHQDRMRPPQSRGYPYGVPTGGAYPYPQYPASSSYFQNYRGAMSSGAPYFPGQPPAGRYHAPAYYRDERFEVPPSTSEKMSRQGELVRPEWTNNTQGSQTFVTAISVGAGNRTLNPSIAREELPSQVHGHHRKLSSFSSLGTLLGAGSVFSPGGAEQHPLKKGHHRSTSSTVSFLHGLDSAIDSTDDTFLRNLQACNAIATDVPPVAHPSGTKAASPLPLPATSSSTAPQLATGCTSKRVRRKCTREGCTNRVVQGGLCIAHGAKRKICRHPGCTKNVKKAGLCSTHGPARKRCEHEGCGKVAVQGGRCIAHGAKKRQCSVADCAKQAILAGMCKKHHDQAKAASGGPTHQRGLSIFQELPADTVQSILTGEQQRQKASW